MGSDEKVSERNFSNRLEAGIFPSLKAGSKSLTRTKGYGTWKIK